MNGAPNVSAGFMLWATRRFSGLMIRIRLKPSSMSALAFSLRLFYWHAEAQIVTVWISDRKFP
jgi:hypothetical protein